MTRAALLVALLLSAGAALVGCGGAAESPDDRACDRAANDDPAVKLLIMKGLGDPYVQNNSQDELNAAKQQARLVCLRGHGLAPAGGVERQRPL